MPDPGRDRPALMFYCQHSLGIGHLVRSLALCESLSDSFRVVLASGGVIPDGVDPPPDVEVVALPAVTSTADFALVTGAATADLRATLERRRRMLVDCFHAVVPEVVVVELYPFGRKKFGVEIQALLEEARREDVLVVCSLRDIVVAKRDDGRADEQSLHVANHYLDAVLVHADRRLGPVDEVIGYGAGLDVPVLHTGFVVPDRPRRPGALTDKADRVVVSAGGGVVGEPLVQVALEAQPEILATTGLTMRVIAGPLVPPEAWDRLTGEGGGRAGLELVRSVPDLVAELEAARVSVSQCGYNTALDLVRAAVPAVVVPVEAEGGEQLRRARVLEGLGLARVVTHPDAAGLAAAVREALCEPVPPVDLDLGGAAQAAEIISTLLEDAGGPAHLRSRRGSWLDPLRAVLDRTPAPVTFFFRDDDVGWGDDALVPLLDLFLSRSLPVDLACIPRALGTGLARQLLGLAEGSAGMGYLQHGLAHRNHEAEGKKSEFGPSRPRPVQRADLVSGQRRLSELVGPALLPVFVPPWNRCVATTVECLVELGFHAVSREAGAEPRAPAGLAQIDTSVEWFRRRKGVPLTLVQIGQQLAEAAAGDRPVGVLVHHERIDREERAALAALLDLVAAHRGARCVSMVAELGQNRAVAPSSGGPR